MPSRHSKGGADRQNFTNVEKSKSDVGTIRLRLGTESQLPFGYCPLSLQPVEDGVVSPSGRIYSREAILEYLLNKTKEIKQLNASNEDIKARKQAEESAKELEEEEKVKLKFAETQGVVSILKRKTTETNPDELEAQRLRKKVFDDTDKETRLVELKRVSPWLPQFTPSASTTEIKEPPKRPPSPFSGQPLRTKDLIPIDLIREVVDTDSISSGPVRFMCPVSRRTITNQKVILIKKTGTYMLESVATQLAYPSMTDPMTGKSFSISDVIELVSAASGFAASGEVVATKYRLSIT